MTGDLKSLGLVHGVPKSDEFAFPLHHLGVHVVHQLLRAFVHLCWCVPVTSCVHMQAHGNEHPVAWEDGSAGESKAHLVDDEFATSLDVLEHLLEDVGNLHRFCINIRKSVHGVQAFAHEPGQQFHLLSLALGHTCARACMHT